MGLCEPRVTVWVAREVADLLGVGALSELDPTHGEVTSMRGRTAAWAWGRGGAVGDNPRCRPSAGVSTGQLGDRVLGVLRTGAALYAGHGLVECGPLADYVLDPNSIYR